MSRGSRRPAPFGIVAVDKPAGPTSHDVVGWIRWVLGTREVGHCGTLDPAATGVLVVCVGGATRLVPLLTADDKEYEAVFVVGASTDTLDADGEVTARAEVSSEALGRA
ncbi:MAG: tRNA pseudouridine(55) synthase TruB, partial [Nannocystaceae bacterium]